MSRTLVILEGDETGQELLEESLRVLDPGIIRVPLVFQRFDLSLPRRRETKNEVVREAAWALCDAGIGIKAATITPEGRDDIGSPNAILRKEMNAKVILRVGRRIPNIMTVAGVSAPIAVVRMAVDDAYGAKEWREGHGLDEVAYRTTLVTRRTCHAVAEFAFQYAQRTSSKVFGGPKYTVSPFYEGMFKEELDAAAARHPSVRYEPQLIDATYALLLTKAGEALVIPTLNRDGDCMSDLVLQMFGSIAGSESLVLGFDDQFEPNVIMAEAPHGTAPRLYGKNLANPLAMILAGASVLGYVGTQAADTASRAIYESALETIYDGISTPDLGHHASTSEFTDEVIKRVRKKLDVWASLG